MLQASFSCLKFRKTQNQVCRCLVDEMNLEIGDSTVKFSSRWLLHQLIIHLEAHMSYTCIHKKFGTILYRKHGDILTALSWALGTSHLNEKSTEKEINPGACSSQINILHEAGNVMNGLLQKEVKRLSREENDPKIFNIDKFTLRVKITCPKSRVLLSSFAASITRIYCARARTTVEDHGCTGQGKHATRTTTQRFSRPMPLLLLYRAPSFGCSSFFVHRGLCKNRSIDVRGRTQCYT